MKTVLALAVLLTFFSATKSYAIVDMNSAAYSNVWTDIAVPGTGYDLKVVRAYKSRTLFNGIFGFGWCSTFETKLEPTSEGNIKITPDSNLKISGGLSYNPQNNELSGLSSLEFTVPSKVALTLEQQIKKDGSNVGLHLKFNL